MKAIKNIGNALLEDLHRRLVIGRQSLLELALDIERQSQMEVPRDTESAARSNFIIEEDRADGVQVTVGYGGPNVQINPKTGQPTTEYLLALHEDLAFRHPNGKAKFLEDPANRVFQKAMNKIMKDQQNLIR